MSGENLRNKRKERNMTLKQVSARTDIPMSLLSLYERNKVMPSAKNMAKLSQLYEMSMEAIMTHPATGDVQKITEIPDELDDELFTQQQQIIADQSSTIKTQADTISKLVNIISVK